MKRSWTGIGAAVLLILLTAALWAPDTSWSVQVREGKLREKPSFLGKIVATVAYGDPMTQVDEKTGWMKVRNATGVEGWIHASALSEKKIVLRSGDTDVETGASGDEIALAGKGFNEEVEKKYRDTHPEVDFTWVDRMEGWRVSPEEALAFLNEGLVQPQGQSSEGGGR